MRLLDLFSGIGGFSLGLERAGFKTVAFCEIEKFPRKVLAKHWPTVPIYGDIRELSAERLAADGIAVDAICGGFPCQDISTAGKGAGIEGERSGLWKEYARLVGEIRPRVIFVENVAALLGRGLDVVLGDVAALGYDAEWHCIPASAVGAPHRRDRVWIVAHAEHTGPYETSQRRGAGKGEKEGRMLEFERRCFSPTFMADTISERGRCGNDQRENAVYADSCRETIGTGTYRERWATEPKLGRVAHGIPNRVDRLKGLGNAVVPQIPEMLGRAYLESINA